MNDKKISIIIPIYNMDKYLEECLNSILGQSLNNIEIICIDDESSDNSLNIIKKYANFDKRITIIQQKNSGAGIARNKGIEKSSGEFIAFMDPDDFYPDNNVLEDLYSSSINNNVDMCGGNCKMLYENLSKSLNNNEQNDLRIRQKRELEHNLIFNENKIINSNEYYYSYCYWRFIYKKEFLDKNKIIFPRYRRFQDPPFLANILVKNIKIMSLKRLSYVYRINHKITKYNYQKYYESILGNKDCIFIYLENKKYDHLTLIFNDFIERVLKLNSIPNLTYNEYTTIKIEVNNIFDNINYYKINKKLFKKIDCDLVKDLSNILNTNNLNNFLYFVQSF